MRLRDRRRRARIERAQIRIELEFIRAVLPDATVDRISHMVAGAPECGYRVVAGDQD